MRAAGKSLSQPKVNLDGVLQVAPERQPYRERRGGMRQRHPEDGMAVQDGHRNP